MVRGDMSERQSCGDMKILKDTIDDSSGQSVVCRSSDARRK